MQLIILMQLLKEEFEKYNIPYWLDEGTLLGAIRNGEIMNILKYLLAKYDYNIVL